MSYKILPSGLVPVSCNRDCGGGCPLAAKIKGGKVVEIKDSPNIPADMIGCARGYRYGETLYHKDRLRDPLISEGERGSGKYRAVSWEDALDFTASRLERMIEKYGSNGIIHLGGSGSCRGAVHNTSRLPRRFFNLLGGYSGTDGNYSAGAVRFTMPYLFGTADTGLDPGTLADSKMLILWGANISDTRFGSNFETWVRRVKNAGVPVVVIDPRKSGTVKRCATEWIPIYPGTDAAMMCAVLYVLIKNGMTDKDFLGDYCIGSEELKEMILGNSDGVARTPEWAEKVCGVPAAKIIDFAERYGASKPAALLPGLSIQRTVGGEETSRLAVALQAFTGNIGISGGSSGGMPWGSLPEPECGEIPLKEHEKTFRLPVYTWTDWVLSGKKDAYPSDIHGIYNVGGNYCIQGSDVGKNIKALCKSDFSVCHELFLTPTARYCDVVFPVTTFLERKDIVFIGANYLLYSEQAVAPMNNVKNDYDIFWELSKRLGIEKEFTEGKRGEDWVEWCLDKSEIKDREAFKMRGIYNGGEHHRTAFSDFRNDPCGRPLPTESGLIELVSKAYAEDTGFSDVPVPRFLDPDKGFPLRLITPHAKSRVNSQNSNVDWCKKREPAVLGIHPRDASYRGLADGETAEVVSSHGSLAITVARTEEILPGVVSILQGAWPAMNSAGLTAEDNPNFCTSAEPTMPSRGSRTHSTWVDVRKEAKK